MTTRATLDYKPRLDERNRAYRLTADRDLSLQPRFWVPGSFVTNQGTEGACVGHGVVNEAMASPARRRFVAVNGVANAVYREAQKIDEWEGEAYDGTSVRAGMLVGRSRGWWSGFTWAFTMAELRTALETGPVVIGVEWREDSYEAPGGILRVTGRVVGGHCILLTGYTPRHTKIGGPAYRIRNSWSASWGANGSAYLSAPDLDQILFQAGGEAASAVGRAP